MKRVTCLVLLCISGLPSGCEAPQDDGPTNDLKKLQGRWIVVDIKSSNDAANVGMGAIVEFEGNKVRTIVGGTTRFEGEFEIDQTVTPRTIDLIGKKNLREKCIYDLANGTLKLRYPSFLHPNRPTSYDPNVKSEQPIIILRRQ